MINYGQASWFLFLHVFLNKVQSSQDKPLEQRFPKESSRRLPAKTTVNLS